MENPKVDPRLPPIMHAYLDDLAALGAYGKGKRGVARTFIERGIQEAIEKGVIKKRDVADFKNGDSE